MSEPVRHHLRSHLPVLWVALMLALPPTLGGVLCWLADRRARPVQGTVICTWRMP